MNNKDLTYEKIMKLINFVKMASGCDEVALYGNNQTFEKLMELGFPLGEFKCENVSDMFDDPRLYIMPILKP